MLPAGASRGWKTLVTLPPDATRGLAPVAADSTSGFASAGSGTAADTTVGGEGGGVASAAGDGEHSCERRSWGVHGATEAPSSTSTRLGTRDTSDALNLNASASTVIVAALGGGGEAGGDVAVAVEIE